MKRIPEKDVNGRTWYRLQPENERERIELANRTDLAVGGIGDRDDDDDTDDNFDFGWGAVAPACRRRRRRCCRRRVQGQR